MPPIANFGPLIPWREIVAIHEAGHVLVDLRRGRTMRYVTMRPREKGTAAYVVHTENKRGSEPHHVMTTAIAGAIAQDIATECRDRIRGTRCGTPDFTEVHACARQIRAEHRRGQDTGMDLPQRPTVRKIAEIAWHDAYQIITAEYGGLLAVADALLHTSRALTRDNCLHIVNNAGYVEPPPIARLAAQFWPPRFMPGFWDNGDPDRTPVPSVRVAVMT